MASTSETPKTPGMSEDLDKWLRKKNTPAVKFPVYLSDPSIPLPTLMGLAIRNSPTGYCTHNQIYSFILHHFPRFRYIPEENWRNSVRKQISHPKFRIEKGSTAKANRFYLADPEQFENVFRLSNLKMFARKDPRGPDFFKRMIDGKIGLPRQLFYNVVALGAPWFAGPENSAVFYYLLSIGHIVQKEEPVFREYYQPNPSIKEAWFIEPEIPWNQRTYEDPSDFPEFRRALISKDHEMRISSEQIARFHDNIEEYFRLQLTYLHKSIQIWTTPRHVDVKKFVLEGPIRKTVYCPRPESIPGSLYAERIADTSDEVIATAVKEEDENLLKFLKIPANEQVMKIMIETLQQNQAVKRQIQDDKPDEGPMVQRPRGSEDPDTH